MKSAATAKHLHKKRLKSVLNHAWSRLGKTQKIAIFGVTLLLLAIAVMLCFYPTNNRIKLNISTTAPTPAHFRDDISAAFLSSDNVPDINNNRELSHPAQLMVHFNPRSDSYTDIFRPNLTPDDLAKSIKMTPFVKGTWHDGYDTLNFIPAQSWPANTKFTVRINKNIFNSDVAARNFTTTFRTADITATVDSFNVYPDATQPKSMVGIAVISFNYPINTTDFANKVILKLDNRNLKFNVKFDRFYRTAFIISDPVTITDTPQTMRLKLNKIPAQSGDGSTKKLTAHTTLESADNFFKISGVNATVADNSNGDIQQLLLINTTAAAPKSPQWNKYIQVYLLPQQHPDKTDEDENHQWQLDEITQQILQKSKQIKIQPVDFASPHGVYQYAFSYEISTPAPRYMYVKINPGLTSAGGFEMQNGMDKVLPVPYPEPTVKIAGSGALLSLAGDRKLGIIAQGGVPQAYINLYKIKSSEINHLVSQTYALFSNDLEFRSYSFGKYDMAAVFQKTIPFANPSVTRTNYASLDLGEYLDRTGSDKTGIFIIQTGATRDGTEYADQRLIMLTDLGLIFKRNHDDSVTLFVSKLSTGTPAPDTEISVLGRNGNPIWAGRTDENGHAEIPAFAPSEYKNARQPVAVVASNMDDVTFIPYASDYSLYTEYSKFDIDGQYSSHTTPLNAYVFSDRGIYRPGESAIIAGIVKNKAFKSIAGVPVKIEILDSRGHQVLSHPISLESDGMFDVTYQIPESAAIGTYTIRIFSLNSKNKVQDMLGSATFNTEEFAPDTMKITATIPSESENGWVLPSDINANVFLQNLFGTPAANRRISATATMQPIDFTFPEYKNYTFTPHFSSAGGLARGAISHGQTYTTEISDIQTDDAGHADINIDFNTDIAQGTYLLNLNIHGYENNSGKSVQTTITSRVSTSPYLIGYHSASDLSYINRNANVSVNLIALDNAANRTNATDLTLRLIKRENLTSLIKDSNNYYKYQTVSRDKTISERKINIPDTGTDISLDTTGGGTYFVQIIDSNDTILSNIEYFIASSDNTSLQTETDAEMKIKLDKASYNPGDTIFVNITTPYVGAGIITIERDKVYAYQWFVTNSTSSVQAITVPEKFDGTGYVNVAFVRNINSHDIFTSPYTYAVAPFSTDIGAHKIDVRLSAPEKINSNKLVIEYETNKNARLMIFAVNTGILQVARYKIPNPLAHFFQKAALQVDTFQTLSLLLPEYSILREYAKTGGGDYAELTPEMSQILTNPFARKLSRSVAFYSGIISTTANTPSTVTFDIPDDFNGSIKTFAIAADDTAMGAANTQTTVQTPIVIASTMPTFIAPTDTIDVGVTVSNLTPDSGNDATITVLANVSESLTLNGKNNETLNVPENSDQTISLNISANNIPSSAELTINASLFGADNTPLATRRSITTTSIRPITTYTTHITGGEIKSGTQSVRNFLVPMYQNAGTQHIYISANANAAIKPLFNYLSKYEFTCSEQTVSRAIPYVLMPRDAFLGTQHDASTQKISDTINTLKTRQNDDGSFDLWAGTSDINNESDADTAYLTAYIVQFLTMARDNGFNVPKDMLSRAVDYLRTYAGTPITNQSDAMATAYAIYVITNNGYITTSYINLFEEYARDHIKNWEQDLMGAYIATSYKLLKQSDKAANLISKYKTSKSNRFTYKNMFRNNIADDAMYMYLMHQHFKSDFSAVPTSIQEYLNSGNYSAYTSAAVIMGLSGVKSDATDLLKNVSVSVGDQKLSGDITGNTYVAEIPYNTKNISITCPNCNHNARLFYTIQQSGFPTQANPATNGMEIIREYYDASGNRITSAQIGDTVTVKIFARSRNSYIPNVVITDLLPGGFIPDTDSMIGDSEFFEFRDDRVLIYTSLTGTNKTIEYKAQIGTAGTFAIPPIHGQSMYNPQINATGTVGGTFTVSNANTTE